MNDIHNINPFFKGKINIKQDILSYIDEAGDEGFNFPKSTDWFVVSALTATKNQSDLMLKTIKEFKDKYCKNKKHISFNDLNHNQRKNLLGMLSKYKYLTNHSVFYKKEINKENRIATYPSMYFIGIKNILERLSWIPKQYNKKRVHILISNRNSIDKSSLSKYLFETSVKADRNLMYLDQIGIVSLSNPKNRQKLLLADYSASTMFQCLEVASEAKVIETIYFDIFLRGKLYSSTHNKYKGVKNNGFKYTPKDINEDLIYSGILEEGSHTF